LVEGRPETTLTEKFKTDVRMLPRFGPLDGHAADNRLGWDKTGLTETLLGKGEAIAPKVIDESR
jgi:hypothetical protein